MWSPSWMLQQPGSPLLPCLALCVELYPQSKPKRTLSPLGWVFGHSAEEGTAGHGCPCRVCLGCPSSSCAKLRLFQEQDHYLSESIIVLGLLAFLHPSLPRNLTSLPCPEPNRRSCDPTLSLQCLGPVQALHSC